jgi:hypothetical protein
MPMPSPIRPEPVIPAPPPPAPLPGIDAPEAERTVLDWLGEDDED